MPNEPRIFDIKHLHEGGIYLMQMQTFFYRRRLVRLKGYRPLNLVEVVRFRGMGSKKGRYPRVYYRMIASRVKKKSTFDAAGKLRYISAWRMRAHHICFTPVGLEELPLCISWPHIYPPYKSLLGQEGPCRTVPGGCQ